MFGADGKVTKVKSTIHEHEMPQEVQSKVYYCGSLISSSGGLGQLLLPVVCE